MILIKPIVSFIGRSNSGKTTLLVKVVREFKKRGFKVAVIKHVGHATDKLEVDKPGKDSWRYAQAGADSVVISSRYKLAIIEELQQEKSVDEIAQAIQDVDLILTEGYKAADKPKIEVLRKQLSSELLCSTDDLIAVVADCKIPANLPQFGFNDIEKLVNFLTDEFIKPTY